MYINYEKRFLWTTLHIAIAYLSTLSRWAFILWILIYIISSLLEIIRLDRKSTINAAILLLTYVSSCELWGRMVDAHPFIPYEIGKYISLSIPLLIFFLRPNRITSIGILMVLMLVPGLLIDISGIRTYPNIAFNLFAPLGMALLVTTLGDFSVNAKFFHNILWMVWLGSLGTLFYAYLGTPDLSSISFILGANYATTGGEASNQVSTIMGLGVFLSLYSWANHIKFSGYRLLDLVIAVMFMFQGLITFSRGGLITALVGLLIVFVYSQISKIRINKKNNQIKISPIYILIGILLVGLIFSRVDKLTGGKLSLRYKGETEATLLGAKEKSFNVITTNRYSIFVEDLSLWGEYPVLGVGVGSSKFLRNDGAFDPHIEISRLVAEHGIFGFCYACLWLFLGVKIFRKRVNPYKGILLALYVIAFLTSFHSAMRTYVTPILTMISILHITDNNNTNNVKSSHH